MDKHAITPLEDLITPERRAKGDLEVTINLKGKIDRAIPASLTIMKELIRRDVFPYHYEIYGISFLELRNAYRSPWAVRSSAVLLEQWGVGVSENKAGSIYQVVCRILGKGRIDVIQYVMEENKQSENKQHHEIYKDSFDLLMEVMDEEREKYFNLMQQL